MDSTAIIAYCGLALSSAGAVFAAIQHKRIRSNCCGKLLEASFDIESTTPKPSATLTLPS